MPTNSPRIQGHIDLTEDGYGLGADTTPGYQSQPGAQSAGSQASVSDASKSLAGCGGVIGAIIGGVIGLGAGGIGCIPGAFLGFVIGSLLGSVLIYLIVIFFMGGVGALFGSAGGPDAAAAGAVIGGIIGIIIIVITCSKKS